MVLQSAGKAYRTVPAVKTSSCSTWLKGHSYSCWFINLIAAFTASFIALYSPTAEVKLDEVKLEEKSELNDTSSEISRLDMEEIELKEDNSNIGDELLETTNLNDLNIENTQIEDNSELEENNQSELEYFLFNIDWFNKNIKLSEINNILNHSLLYLLYM